MKIGKVRHASCGQIFVEALTGIGLRVYGVIQLSKFCKGERVDYKFHISSGKIGRKLTGKQFGIGAGNIDITVEFNTKGIDTFLPGVHLLYFIKKKIDLAMDFRGSADDLIMERRGGTEMSITHILKVNGYKLTAVCTRGAQFLLDQIQHH